MKTVRELRKFGFLFACGMTVMASLFFWRGVRYWPIPVVLGSFTLLGALINPRWLGPFERFLERMLRAITAAVTWVVLVLAFFLVFTPFGLLLRAFGKDLLERRIEPEAKTYWRPADTDGSASRPGQPY